MRKEEKYVYDLMTSMDVVSPELIMSDLDISSKELRDILVAIWDELPNPCLYDGGLRAKEPEETYYYEICDTRFRRGKICRFHKLKKVIGYQYVNPKEDQHMSAFAHDNDWAGEVFSNRSIQSRKTRVKSPYLWVELDRETLTDAITDAWLIACNFPYPEHMRFWYSGNKSIHIGINSRLFGSPVDIESRVCGRGKLWYNLAHRVVQDVRHNNGLVDPYFETEEVVQQYFNWTFGGSMDNDKAGFLKQRQLLENTDPSIYNMNSLLRMPNSIHESGKKKKVELSLDDLANHNLRGRPPAKLKKVPPHLFHWTLECYEPKERPASKRTKVVVDSTSAIEFYSHIFNDFDPNDANHNGYVTALFNPLYEDTNPSVSINVENGILHDFGTGESYSAPEFLDGLQGIGVKKAKTIIENKRWNQL